LTAQDMDIPGFIRDYLYSLDPGYEISTVIRDKYPRLILRVKINGRDCLVKAVRRLTLWKRPGRYFRFQKEIFIYRRLDRLDFKHFRHPRLINTDGKRILVTEYIENQASLPMDESFHEQALKAVLELNTCDFPFQAKGGVGWLWEKINRWKFSRSTKTLRHLLEGTLISRDISLRIFGKALLFWARSLRSSAVFNPPLLMHRDIFHANILRPDPGSVFLIDFEKMGLEKRWVFGDALKVAQAGQWLFSAESQDEGDECSAWFRADLIRAYWQGLLHGRPDIFAGPEHFTAQLKFCLLGIILSRLVKRNNSPGHKASLLRFIDEVILGPGEGFERWFKESGKSVGKD
jgi:hypothetical protein